MAISVLKNTPTHCVVKVSGANASETIALATTLLRTREVATAPVVHIVGLHWSIPGVNDATISRNSVLLWTLHDAYSMEMNGWSDSSESISDIVVTIPAAGGTVVIELAKISGYSNDQHLNQDYDSMISTTTTTTAVPTTTTTTTP